MPAENIDPYTDEQEEFATLFHDLAQQALMAAEHNENNEVLAARAAIEVMIPNNARMGNVNEDGLNVRSFLTYSQNELLAFLGNVQTIASHCLEREIDLDEANGLIAEAYQDHANLLDYRPPNAEGVDDNQRDELIVVNEKISKLCEALALVLPQLRVDRAPRF